MDAAPSPPSFREFVLDTLIKGFQEARRLRAFIDDESEPYKSKYAAADMLQLLEQQTASYVTAGTHCDDLINHCLARCQLERGLVLLETDLTGDGQKAVEQGLEHDWPATTTSHAIRQQGNNALGGLWCGREEFDTSLRYLQAASDLYETIKAQSNSSGSSSTPTDLSAASADASADPSEKQTQLSKVWEESFAADAKEVEQQYTTTLYYMAQVYGYAGDKLRSASYCAATLNRQLQEGKEEAEVKHLMSVSILRRLCCNCASWLGETLLRARTIEHIVSLCRGPRGDQLSVCVLQEIDACNGVMYILFCRQPQVNDWVQNCLQLSGYFLDGNAFALSQYCCTAVELMLLQWHSKQQQEQQQQRQQQQANAAAETTGLPQQEEQSHQEPQQEPGAVDGSEEGLSSNTSAAAKNGGQGAGQAAKKLEAAANGSRDQQQASRTIARLQPALKCLDEDVAANVHLAFAKLYLYTLVASHERYVEQKQVQYSFLSPSDVPDVLRFTALKDLPQLSDLQWGDDALANGYPEALRLYQQALPWYKEALQYYRLEGWVTEHCHILFEMSNLYRCLAGFESDPHKRCVIHRNRAKLLQDLEGELSPIHYPGLSRSISLELGNIFREIGDIKAAAGRQPDKVASAGLSATKHYRLFLDSFRGDDGKLPDKVEPAMEQHFINAAFCLARLLQSSSGVHKDPGSSAAAVEQAIHWLSIVVQYVDRNKVTAHQEEAQLAQEMAELLQEKLALMLGMQRQLARS